MARKVPLKFYQRPTDSVAQDLLGKRLVRMVNGQRLSGLIVETEAYLGNEDPACHSFNNRKTQRNNSMFLKGGHSYVYFIYGMYFCFNVVTRGVDQPEAVLIRAVEPDGGLELMKKNRKTDRTFNLTSGPGKLCMAMEIDRELDGVSLLGNDIFIEDTNVRYDRIQKSPRIGIGDKHEACFWPLRFHVEDNKYVSKRT